MELRHRLVPLLLLLVSWPVTARLEVEVLLDVKNALDPQGMVLMSWQVGGQPCSNAFEGVLCDSGADNLAIPYFSKSFGVQSYTVVEIMSLPGLMRFSG